MFGKNLVMPKGKGTYGSKVGRPPQKKKAAPKKPAPRKPKPAPKKAAPKKPAPPAKKPKAPQKVLVDIPTSSPLKGMPGVKEKPLSYPRMREESKPKLKPPTVNLKPKPRNKSLPIAPKNQKATGRAIAKNAPLPHDVPNKKPTTAQQKAKAAEKRARAAAVKAARV